jgi:hypothetical protein
MRLLGSALLCLALSLFVALPADATVVYVTYTGTVIRGDDPNGVFGQGSSLAGDPFEVDYVFDTDLGPCGGTAFNAPSPLIEPAVLTIGPASTNINGDQAGEISVNTNATAGYVEWYLSAWDSNGNAIETDIRNYDGTLPASLTTPFLYYATPSDGGPSDFSAFGASGYLSIATLRYSLSPISPVPLPPALLLFATGLGLMGLFDWWRRHKAAAA